MSSLSLYEARITSSDPRLSLYLPFEDRCRTRLEGLGVVAVRQGGTSHFPFFESRLPLNWSVASNTWLPLNKREIFLIDPQNRPRALVYMSFSFPKQGYVHCFSEQESILMQQEAEEQYEPGFRDSIRETRAGICARYTMAELSQPYEDIQELLEDAEYLQEELLAEQIEDEIWTPIIYRAGELAASASRQEDE